MTNTVYDCEEAETEIVSLSEDFDENPVMATCNLFQIKLMNMLPRMWRCR